LPLGHRLCAGCTRRRAGLAEPKLAAASAACGTNTMGAATEPLDGRAFTVGVDARAGEGAGSSAAILHRATKGGIPLWILRFFCSLRCFGGGVGERSEEGGSLPRSRTGQRRSLPPAGPPARGQCCVVLRVKEKNGNGSRVSKEFRLIYSPVFGEMDLSRRSADRRRRSSGRCVGHFEPRRVEELGRLAGTAIGCWTPSPGGRGKVATGRISQLGQNGPL
jgi:hypothetical protein